MDEREKSVFRTHCIAEFISKSIWILLHVLPALIIGRVFGIVAERVVFCMILGVSALKHIETLEMLEDMTECVDEIIDTIEKKKEIEDEPD